MEHIVVDRSGTLKDGYFYELDVMLGDDSLSMQPSNTPKLDIVSLRQPTEDELAKKLRREKKEGDYVSALIDGCDGWDKVHDCSIDKAHITCDYWTTLKVRLWGGPYYSDLIYGDMEGNRAFFVPDRMAQRLRASPFRGYRLVEVKDVDYSGATNQSLNAKNFPLYELQFRGRACRRGFSVVGAPNACPHCGRKPLICPECGDYQLDCPDCKQEAWIAKKNHKGPNDKRLTPAGWDQWSPMVIDVNRWDGADFIYVTRDAGLETNVVTKRVIDWLLSIHAAPFLARRVMARLDGATAEQLKMLEVAKGK